MMDGIINIELAEKLFPIVLRISVTILFSSVGSMIWGLFTGNRSSLWTVTLDPFANSNQFMDIQKLAFQGRIILV